MKRALLLFGAFPALAHGCYNDRDTLGYELRNRPDVQRALTGRFERNPPLYYRMRVERLRRKESLTSAERDDLAVALDRVGRSDEALAALTLKDRTTTMAKYRFYANRGTIRAHRWLYRGAKATEVKDLQAAEADIDRALRLNPKAHFGREGTQLWVLRWFEANAQGKGSESLGGYLLGHKEKADPLIGLAGLTTLGAAWESSDVALAMGELAAEDMRYALAEMGVLRYRELLAAGRRSSSPGLSNAKAESLEGIYDHLEGPRGEKSISREYADLRREAEAWQEARTAFLLAGLRKGRHPDTDPRFWAGWKDSPAPRLDPQRLEPASVGRNRLLYVLLGLFALGFVALCVGMVALARRIVRRLRRKGA